MEEVTLQQILDAREERAARQAELLRRFQKPLVCFTMNIPGPVKNSPLIRRSFREGCRMLESRLPAIAHREIREEATGCQAMYVAEGDARRVKALCTQMEEETPLGRLFDMDVLEPTGRKLERQQLRGCIVCGAPGRGCAARRLHSVQELQHTVRSMMTAHFSRRDGARIAALAVQSLLDEVNITPKPGLVDRRNTGSHRDMDLSVFTASALALEPYFRECVRIGMETGMDSPEETFARLRRAGLEAEETMYRVTGGVNTHKGAIFTLGILCGGLGRLWKPETPICGTEALRKVCGEMGAVALNGDFSRSLSENTTAGERLYRSRGLTGIRGEVAAGLPSVMQVGLPAFRRGLAGGLSPNDAGAIALLHLIARVEDTNLYHRGGPEGAAWAKGAAQRLLPSPSMEEIRKLDDQFIARNLSPGGCADLLAVTCFLHSLEGEIC